jgi:hypothetical protein
LRRLAVEQIDIDATGGEGLHVGDRCLAFRAGKRLLDRRDIVELQNRDKVIGGWAARSGDGAFADLVVSYAGNFLGKRNVLLRIMLVECGRVSRRFIHHQEPGHRAVLLFCAKDGKGRTVPPC